MFLTPFPALAYPFFLFYGGEKYSYFPFCWKGNNASHAGCIKYIWFVTYYLWFLVTMLLLFLSNPILDSAIYSYQITFYPWEHDLYSKKAHLLSHHLYVLMHCRRFKLERQLASSQVPKEQQIDLIKDLERKETEYMRLKRHKICVDDFELLTIIGRGAFGEVCKLSFSIYFSICSTFDKYYLYLYFCWWRCM